MSLKVSEQPFYYREYEKDIHSQSIPTNRKSYLERVAVASLPFLSLYRPAEKALSLVMGSARVITQGSELKNQAYNGTSYEAFKSFLKTTMAVSSLTLTIGGLSSLGMAVTTVQDLLGNCERVYVIYNQQGLSWDTSFVVGQILNSGFYLGLILYGSFEFMAISFSVQVVTNLYQSLSELKEGNYLEAISHISMSVVRGSQFYAQLQTQKAISTIPSKKIEQEIETSEKLKTAQDSRFKKEILQGRKKWDPALDLLEEQHHKQLYDIHGSFSDNFHYSKDSSGNLKATWLCEDKNWNFAVRTASYNSQAKAWTQPKGQSIDLLSHFSFGSQLKDFNQKDVLIKIKMDSFKNLGAICVFPGEKADSCNSQETLQAIAFDIEKNSWFSSDTISISCFSDLCKKALPDLKMDQYGNMTTIWHDAGNRTLESMHCKKGEAWSSVVKVDSDVLIDELYLTSVPSQGMVAIWKGSQALKPTKSLFPFPRNVIRASNYNLTDNAWVTPVNLVDLDSIRLREIEDFLFHVDAQGNIIIVWEEQPDDRLLDIYEIIQNAKQYPDEFNEWLFGDDDEWLFENEDAFYKERLELKNFINSIHSFEDFIHQELSYKGQVSLKEFLKLNDHRGNSIAGAIFNASSGDWDKLSFPLEGESPKIIELSSGKTLVGWQSWNSFFATRRAKELDRYTDQEIESGEGDGYAANEGDFKEYIQFGLYDPKTKEWSVDLSSLKCSPSRYSLCLNEMDHQSENVLVVWEETEGNWDNLKVKLLASVYNPITKTRSSKKFFITQDLVKDFGISRDYTSHDLKINVNEVIKDSATITIDILWGKSVLSSKTCKVQLP
ncbi:MAG: hypothetical protein PVI40_05235 [Chlamydiota bacterium]|jgi:hypothetical protein